MKKACASCQTCAEVKPNFYSPPLGTLIKATHPMERLNIDFKGPLPSTSKNKYFLCIVDEYSRFPFVYPCEDQGTSTITRCFDDLFHMFGTCSYIHSDRWSAFRGSDLKKYFVAKGIPRSFSSPYHPLGNSQVERYNGIVWQAITSLLKSQKLKECHWESVLPSALHGIRSLLCTATNDTPHKRFFGFDRRSSFGTSLPGWLTEPGPVLLRNFNRSSKYDSKVCQVQLEEANPLYAKVRFPNGREGNVSVRDLAPCSQGGSNENMDARLEPNPEVTSNNDNSEEEGQSADLSSDNASSHDMNDGNHVSTDEVVPGLVSPENGNGCTEGETELSETFVNKEVRGVNRWVSTRSSKGILLNDMGMWFPL